MTNEADHIAQEPPSENDERPQQRRRVLFALVGIVALVGIAIGFGTGVWLALPKHPADDSAEAGFARDMSTHHGQAVSMAMIQYRNGADEQLRTIAYDIATTQQAQIGMMDAWLSEWELSPTSDQPAMSWMPHGEKLVKDGLMPGMATPEQMQQLRDTSGHELDILFCQRMIDHHLGGIHMVDAVLDQTDDDEVRNLANSMKTAQQYEIDVLERKLADFGVQR